MAGLEFETILGLSRAYEAGETSPTEVTRAMLERIERLDPELHAFTVVVSSLPCTRAAPWVSRRINTHESPVHGFGDDADSIAMGLLRLSRQRVRVRRDQEV